MNKRYEVRFYIGTGYDKAGQPLTSVAARRFEAEKIVAGAFQGATVYKHLGLWRDSQETELVTEPGLSIVVLLSEEQLADVLLVAGKLRDLFSQNCVLVTRSEVYAEFV